MTEFEQRIISDFEKRFGMIEMAFAKQSAPTPLKDFILKALADQREVIRGEIEKLPENRVYGHQTERVSEPEY